MNTRTRLAASVRVRYGVRFDGEVELETLYGSDGLPAASVIADAMDGSGDFVRTFIQSLMTPIFAKPLYIGISKDLYSRVYKTHYLDLVDLWDPGSSLSRYLSAHQNMPVQVAMESLGLSHSFAVEARVRGLHPRDLVVFVCPLETPGPLADSANDDDSPTLRSLEQVLQLLADPICGRR